MAANSSAKSLADPILLETIDKLFQYNIGEYVSLPQVSFFDYEKIIGSELMSFQLLVVGDQSRYLR